MRNKQWRKRKGYNKYLKRLKLYGFTVDDEQYIFKSTGSPCSCLGCSGERYSRSVKHKNKQYE